MNRIKERIPNLYRRIIAYQASKCSRLLPYGAGNVLTIEDVFSEGLFVLSKAIASYDKGRKTSFRSYLTSMLENHFQKIVRDAWRLKRREFDSISYDERIHGKNNSEIHLTILLQRKMRKLMKKFRRRSEMSWEKKETNGIVSTKPKRGFVVEMLAKKYKGKAVEYLESYSGDVHNKPVALVEDVVEADYIQHTDAELRLLCLEENGIASRIVRKDIPVKFCFLLRENRTDKRKKEIIEKIRAMVEKESSKSYEKIKIAI